MERSYPGGTTEKRVTTKERKTLKTQSLRQQRDKDRIHAAEHV